MYSYYNGGHSMRAVDDNYKPKPGEVLFDAPPSVAQLDTAFPGFAAEVSDRQRNAAIVAQIAALEALQTPRRLREAALSDDGRAWLADLDAWIAALRPKTNQTGG